MIDLDIAIRAEARKHQHVHPWTFFNVGCTCGYRGQTVSENGDFEIHVATATVNALIAAGALLDGHVPASSVPHEEAQSGND